MAALWRIVGFFINPFFALLWWAARWLGRAVDRRLGPRLGYSFAIGLLALAALSVATAAVSVAPFAGRYVGLTESPPTMTVQGTVIAATSTDDTRLTIRQLVTIAYEHAGQSHQFTESVSEPVTSKHMVGNIVTVYLPEGSAPTIDNPDDRVPGAILILLSLVPPLVVAWFSWIYLRYRRRIFDARPVDPVTELASNRVLSTAERLRADEERMRRRKAGN